MKKILLGFILALAAVGGGWLALREKLARDNADKYLTAREIPTYHALSFHGRDDLNVLGFCKPCGEKAREVLRDRTEKEFDQAKKDLEGVLSGGRK